MILMVYLPYQWGYSAISVLLLALYIPTYFNKDELKYGRPWEWFRQNGFWKYLQHVSDLQQLYLIFLLYVNIPLYIQYGQIEVVREAELDVDRKYIFGYHPHGILILSRISTYGGVFEQMFPGIETRCVRNFML